MAFILKHLFKRPIHLLRCILMALLCVSNVGAAYADDSAEIKKTFLNYKKIQFGDTVAAPWRIVQAKNWKDARDSKTAIAQGMSSPASVATLSEKQREALYAAWLKAPDDIWVVYFKQPAHLELKKIEGKYYIELVASISDAELAQNQASEKAAIESQKPLDPAVYTQVGFDGTKFASDYADWQQRFAQDLKDFEAKLRSDRDYGKRIIVENDLVALKETFANSILEGPKGLALREELIKPYYAGRNKMVTPSGIVFRQLTLNETAKPVGFGGTFIDEGLPIELWYVAFNDMREWTKGDFEDSIVFEAFKKPINEEATADAAAESDSKPPNNQQYKLAELPPYKTIKRNSWPALVFTRESNASVKLYGISMEMARIMGHIFNRQAF